MAEAGQSSGQIVFSSMKPMLLLKEMKAREAVDYYIKVFSARELNREILGKQKGIISELQIGDSVLIVSDERERPDGETDPITAHLHGRKMMDIYLRLECVSYEKVAEKLMVEAANYNLVIDEDPQAKRIHRTKRHMRVKDQFGVTWIIVPVPLLSMKPVLVLTGMKAREAVDYYVKVFSAKELKRMAVPRGEGKQDILISELQIGDSVLIVSETNDGTAETDTTAAETDHTAIHGMFDQKINLRVECEDYIKIVRNLMTEAPNYDTKPVIAMDEEGARIHSRNQQMCNWKVKDQFGIVWIIGPGSDREG